MTVPFLDLSRQYSQIQNEVESAVLEVMRSGAFVEGPAVKSLEDRPCFRMRRWSRFDRCY